MPNLRVLSNHGAGYEHIDVAEAAKFEVELLNRMRRVHHQPLADENTRLVAEAWVLCEAELFYVADTLFGKRINGGNSFS